MAAQERVERFKAVMDDMRQSPDFANDFEIPTFPLTLDVGYHDGPGGMLRDSSGKPVLFDLLRDEELALQVEWLLNKLAEKAGLI